MAMTGEELWAARKAAVDAVPMTQSSNPANAQEYRDAVGIADSTAIVTYIQQAAQVSISSGSSAGTYGVE